MANVGAHRRTAPRVGAPSIIWHRAFWKPATSPSGTNDDVVAAYEAAQKEWYENIDRYLYLLFMQLQDYSHDRVRSPNIDARDLPMRIYLLRHFVDVDPKFSWRLEPPKLNALDDKSRTLRHDSFSMYVVLDGVVVTVRCTLHFEFWTLSVFADFSRAELEIVPPESTLTVIRKTLNEVAQLVSDQFNKDGGQSQLPNKDEARPQSLQSQIHVSFHSFLSTLLFEPSERYFEGQDRSLGILGGFFANFEGLALGFGVRDVKPSRVEKASSLKPAILCPLRSGHSKAESSLSESVGLFSFDGESGLRMVQSVWSVMRGLFDIEGRRKNDLYDALEYTVSLFQRGRAIYMSSLGALEPDFRAADGGIPVRYLVLVSYPSRWQLGRLVDRINRLGTVRLAALRDLHDITTASGRMGSLYGQMRLGLGRRGSDDPADYLQKLTEAQSLVPAGLTYRILRSAAYVRQFESTMKQLGIGRIEGFQQYDDFVRRRLYATFDFIAQVGERYRDLRTEVELRLDRKRTDALVDVQERIEQGTISIRDFQEKIKKGTDALVQLSERLEESTERIKLQHTTTNELLADAENIIILPLAYYTGAITNGLALTILAWFHRFLPEGFGYMVGVMFALSVKIYLSGKRKRRMTVAASGEVGPASALIAAPSASSKPGER